MSSGVRHMVTEAALWAAIGAVAVFGFLNIDRLSDVVQPRLATLEPAPQQHHPEPAPRGSTGIELRADPYGHFLTEASLNGRPVRVMVDTGATVVALTYEDALRVGLRVSPSDFTQRVSTANGVAKVAPVRIDQVAVGDVVVRNVMGVVAERGRLETTLLGMTFLSRVGKVEMAGGRLVLQE